jgi:hypothetical protein
MYGIDWLYSTDYGKSWEFQYAYDSTRRAFEAVRNNEVWITARPPNSPNSPAAIIARTTDNGKTWQEDTKTLTNDGNMDGRILTFSDPAHGWVAAVTGDIKKGYHTYVYRYDASEQPINVVGDSQNGIIQKYYLKVFPNPSSDKVHLQLEQNKKCRTWNFMTY